MTLSRLQSRHLGPSHSFPNCHQLPCHIFLNLKSLFFVKGDFNLGKSQNSQGAKSELYRGWATWVIWCFAKKLCTRCDAWSGTWSWGSCQPPVAHGYSLLNHPNSFHRGKVKLNTKFDAGSLLYSLSHFEYDGHTVHMLAQQCRLPHWLVQWSHRCSCMRILVHSPWLPDYINVVQTILIILTMIGLFLERPHISISPKIQNHPLERGPLVVQASLTRWVF